MDLTGLALVISAILTPSSVVMLAWLNNRNVKRVEGKVETVHVLTAQVDAAVNGKGPGESSISQDVTAIRDKQEFDSPTAPVEPNGRRALVPMVAELGRVLEELITELRQSDGTTLTPEKKEAT